jgi:hypothetical protein
MGNNGRFTNKMEPERDEDVTPVASHPIGLSSRQNSAAPPESKAAGEASSQDLPPAA